MKRAVAIVILLPSIALAQIQSNPSAVTTPSASSAAPTRETGTASAPTTTLPSATGNPHVCGGDLYPPAALAAGEEGNVALSFRIGTDGSPKSISVSATSGYADLDQAAIVCAGQWKYRPAMQDGHPVEADWKANVSWSMEPSNKTINVNMQSLRNISISGTPGQDQRIGSRVCVNPSRPPAPLGKKTVLDFIVDKDGTVEHIKIAHSSGDPVLDGYGIECVARWQYQPWTGPVRQRRIMVVVLPW